jgi:signal transduction histidine kinase
MIWSPPSLASFGRRSRPCVWRSTWHGASGGPLTDKQAELLHAAREDCDRLQAMVDDILIYRAIEVRQDRVIPTADSSCRSHREGHRREKGEASAKACI